MKLLSWGSELPDATEQGAGQLFGGKLLVGEGAGDLGEGQLMQHVSASLLLDDFRNQVQTFFHGGGDGLVGVAVIGLGDRVRTQALGGFQRVGERFDAAGVDRLHLVDQAEDVVQGLGGARKIGLAQAQAGEMGDFSTSERSSAIGSLQQSALEGRRGAMRYIRQGTDAAVGGLIPPGRALWGREKPAI